MEGSPPVLDHVVTDVHDGMDNAAATYRRLGFALTPRGRHSLGSINHLAIFETNYFELLGFDRDAPEVRADIARFPIGLNGLVFGSDDSSATYEAMRRNGVAVQEPLAFVRPVELGGGVHDTARFRVVRLAPEAFSGGRIYFCHHLTRHLVWRDEWRTHPNGARDIAGVTIVAPDPAAIADLFRRMFADAALVRGRDGVTLAMRNSRVEIVAPAVAAARYGDAAPDPAGRTAYLAGVTIRTAGLAQAANVLGGVAMVRAHADRIVVPATQASNVTLEFV